MSSASGIPVLPIGLYGFYLNQSINHQSFICIRPMVHIKDEKIDNKNR